MNKESHLELSQQALRYWGMAIAACSVVLISALIYFGYATLQKFTMIDEGWEQYTTQAARYSSELETLAMQMGYVGFIHHFKNLVLRRDLRHLEPTKKKYASILLSLKRLDAMAQTSEETQDIATLRQTFSGYMHQLPTLIAMIQSGVAVSAIDRVVKIDDSKALRALNDLRGISQRRNRQSQQLINHRFDHATIFFRSGALFLIVVPLFALLLFYFLHRVRQSNTEISAARVRISELIDRAPTAIIIADGEGAVVRVNERAKAMFGYSESEFIALKVESLIPHQYRGNHVRLRSAFIDQPHHRPMGSVAHLCGVRSNGEQFPAEIALSIGHDRDALITITIADTTEKEAARHALEVAKQEAESALLQLQQTQDAIIQSEKMAALGGLVAGVAHEINTPIGNALAAATHLHQQTRTTAVAYRNAELTEEALQAYFDDASRAARLVESNSSRAANLIQSFKQVAVDQTVSMMRRFILKDYIDEVLLSMHHALKQAGVEVTVVCPPSLEIYSDPGTLSQVLTNLLSNSLMHGFGEQGGGEVKITVSSEGAEGQLQLIYSDNGVGIPDAIADKIFDPFFTTRRGSGGSGLGLHIVYNLLHDKLGGAIAYVPSESGSSFRITMPVRIENNE